MSKKKKLLNKKHTSSHQSSTSKQKKKMHDHQRNYLEATIGSTNSDLIKSKSQRRIFHIQPYENPESLMKKKPKKKIQMRQVFGDHITQKEEGIIRIASQNVNCIGITPEVNPKQDNAKDWIIQNEVDIVGWQETGVAFHLLPRRKRLSERMRDIRWNKFRISSSNNKHENAEVFQYGGTAVMAFDEAAHRVHTTGSDTTGLGRWSWILFQGRNNHFTRVISAYVPCKSANDQGRTVYNQHRRFFQRQGITECPRKIMHSQLTQQINVWQNKGERIVLLIDTNENLSRMGALQTKLRFECQLVDPIKEMYLKKHQILPPTSLTGSVPIDSIFVSSNMKDIIRGGWIQVEKSIGDHRSLYIDIPIKTLLGESKFAIHRHTARRLICDHPKIVDKYNKLLNTQLQNQNTFRKYNEFASQHEDGILSEENIISTLNKLDNSITNSILHAEKKCRKLKSGSVPYTPELNNAGKIINVWNNVIRKKKGCNISSTYIKRIAKKVSIINPMSITLAACEKERKLAFAAYRKLKNNAITSRKQFIEELARQQSARGNESLSNAIQRINRNEEMRESYRRIKNVTKPFYGATERVLIPNRKEPGEERVTTKKIEIEKALCTENKKKFTAAYSSPFLQEPLITQLEQTATTATADKILDGTYKPNKSLSKATKEYIKILKTPKSILSQGKNDSQCSLQTSIAYWKGKREKTNSSMSNRHIGTYKALTYGNHDTLHIINEIANAAFNIGFPLERWKKDLDVSLLKKPNKIRPSELRTIGTLEADFNQMASLHFSKRMMTKGIKTLSIPSSQYAKKGNRAIEAAIVKILYFDYLRINKMNGAFLAMDLENCFDRMAHPISSLCSQRLGVPSKVAKCMINTLCDMKHHVRTAYGDSDWSYKGTSTKPLQGAVQGNGAASPIFVAISCTILAYLESQVVGINTYSAITLTLFTLVAILYVDDSDILIAAIEKDETAQAVSIRAQKAAIAYQNGVHQTGGAVRPEKCRWYSISFKWIAGEWKYDNNPNINKVYIQNSDGNNKEIERLKVNKGWKGLGIMAAPDGKWKDHVSYLIDEKIKPWNASISTSYLHRHDVYRSAFTSIFKSIDYTLPATSMTTTQCKLINTRLHSKFLPRIGVDVHLPLEYRYAPKCLQGLGSMNIEVKQFTEKLKIFLQHAGTSSQIGEMIQLMIESMHLLIGVNQPLFSLDYKKYGHLAERGWITHIWEMCDKYEISLDGQYEQPTTARINDCALMELLVKADIYDDKDLRSINKCRIYLEVQNMSDITDGSGTKIAYCALQHIKDPERKSEYKWPKQIKPTKKDWNAWDDAIKDVWTTSETNQVQPKLGKWIQQPHFNTPWYIDQRDPKFLYYKTSEMNYNVYVKKNLQRRQKQYTYKWSHTVNHLPLHCDQAIINRNDPSLPILESIITPIDPPQSSNGTTNLEHHIDVFMQQIDIPTSNIEKLIHTIEKGTAIAVTDASVSPYTGVGASSFVITTPDLQTSSSGSHGVPKGSAPMDSYRAELYGIFSIMVTLQHLATTYDIKKGNILVACDNKAALNNAFAYNDRASLNQGSFDILWAIQSIRKSIKIQIQHQHVKGHQDKTGKPLTKLETLNCIMDRKAGSMREFIETSTIYEYSKLHQYMNWNCSIANQHVTANLEKRIQHHIYKSQIHHYLIHNKKYDKRALEYIDWIGVEQASKSLTNSEQIWLTKFVTSFYATAKKMKERKVWETSLCPICNMSVEDTNHLLTCKDERAIDQYKKSTTKFFQHLQKVHTHPDIIVIFQQVLQNNSPASFTNAIPIYTSESLIREAANEQDVIKWENIFKGHISKKWAEIQLQHYMRMYSNPPSIHHWAKNVILQLYQISKDMWHHRNEIVHECIEEKLNQKESDQLREKIVIEYEKGSRGVLMIHKHMFSEKLTELLEKAVIAKKYWLMQIEASRACVKKLSSPDHDMQGILKRFATVPD